MQPDLALLPPYVDWVEGRRRVDWHLLLFAVNMVLVPVGYYLGISFGLLPAVKAVRTVLMAGSLLLLVLAWRKARWPMKPGRHAIFALFLVAQLLVVPFSVDPSESIDRLLTVAPFWLYINLFAAYLRGRYGPTEGFSRFSWLLLIAYLFPVAVFYLSGNPFERLNIYGDDSRGFFSNHFGWSAAVSLVCLMDKGRHLRPGLVRYLAWGLGLLACLWLLLISGSRTGYLTAAISLLVLVVVGSSIRLRFRVALLAIVVVGGLYTLGTSDSAINVRLQKTQRQLETSEPRQVTARRVLQILARNETRIVTGVGFGMYHEGILLLSGMRPPGLHNSYMEVLIDSGAFVAAIFLFLLVLPALVRYFAYDARRFAFVPPLLIIPYFENNLGAGQFLFFPWMFLFFWYLHDTRWGRARVA